MYLLIRKERDTASVPVTGNGSGGVSCGMRAVRCS